MQDLLLNLVSFKNLTYSGTGLLMAALLSWLVYKLCQLNLMAGIDTGELDENQVADLFGKTKGFKADTPPPAQEVEDEDF